MPLRKLLRRTHGRIIRWCPSAHGDGGGGPTREMLERARLLADMASCPGCAIDSPGGVLRARRGRVAAARRAPLARRAVLRDAPRHLHDPGEHEGGQPTMRGSAPRSGAVAGIRWADGIHADELDRLVEAGARPSSSTTSSPARRSPGCTRTPSASTRRRRSGLIELVEHGAGASGSWIGNGRERRSHRRAEVRSHRRWRRGPRSGSGARRRRLGVHGRCARVGACARRGDGVHGSGRGGTRRLANGQLEVTFDGNGNVVSILDGRFGRELLAAGRHGAELDARPRHARGVRRLGSRALDRGPSGRVGTGRVRRGHRIGPTARFGPGSANLRASRGWSRPSCSGPEVHASMSRSRSSGRSVSGCSRSTFRWTFGPNAPRARCSSATSTGRRTRNTSWDDAKFEVCAQRWVDLSEPGFGVAVLNDGRHGHGVQGGGVRVSLLRGPRYPDPDADRGRHRCTVSLLPHGPGLAEVVAQAEALNLPLRVIDSGSATTVPEPLVTVDDARVQVSAVKLADDGSGDLIVRLWEATGDRVVTVLRLTRPDPRRLGVQPVGGAAHRRRRT